MTRLLLVRHAESRANVAGLVGANEVCTGLTDAGRDQARLLAERLAATGPVPGVAYASSVRRAQETGAVLTERLGLADPVVEPDLREMDPGAAEGLTAEEYAAAYGRLGWLEQTPDQPIAPGGESWHGLVRRATATVERLLERHADATVAAVSHGGFIAAALGGLLAAAPATQRAIIHVAHTSITELRVVGGTVHLVRVGDAAHLASPHDGVRPTTSPTTEATPR